MKSSLLVCTALGLVCVAVTACTPPQTQTGVRPGLYAFHTGQTPTCPGLDWHVTIEPDNGVNGFVAWNQGQHIARLAGTISPDGSFQTQATEVGGAGRKASVSGRAAGTNISIFISGTGTVCDNVMLNVPRVAGGVGGLGGGGG